MKAISWALVFTASLSASVVSAEVAITDVTVVDVSSGTLVPGQSVLISGQRIQQVSASTALAVPASAHVIDGRGKYLIPGLWDMHVHTVSRDVDFPLEVAHGITGIRDMGGSAQKPPPGHWGVSFDVLRDWRAQVRAGTLIGPRIVAGGIALDGPEAFWPQTVSLKTPAEARSMVDSLHHDGVDFVKVYLAMPRETLLAIADQARKRGLTFAGHTSQLMPMIEAAAAGQRTFEHADAFETSYYDQAALREFIFRARRSPFPADVLARVVATYDAKSLPGAVQALKAHGARVDPTLVTWRALACTSETPLDASRAAFVPTHVQSVWQARLKARCGPSANPAHAKRWEHQRAAVRYAHEQGVQILVGSDAWNPNIVPGLSLHDEMALLVSNGMTPGQALQAATLGAAEFLQMTDRLGTVSPGKLADLVLLDGNPLEDIRNTQRVHAVVLNGRFLDRSALDQLLASARSSVTR